MTDTQRVDAPTRTSFRLPWPRRRTTTPAAIGRYTVSAEKHDDAPAHPFTAIARRLPALWSTALRLAWKADPRALLILAALQITVGALPAALLYGTRHGLAALLAQGPVLDRVHTALPALTVITAAAAIRSLAAAATGAVASRLGPRVDSLAEQQFLDATSRVPLASYDDPAWSDASEAANRASKDAHLAVEALGPVLGALLGILVAAGTVTTLHPLLLPLLLLAVLPRAWAAITAAQAAHLAERHTLADRRQRHTLIYNISGRPTALDVRANTMRPWLLREFRTVTDRLEAAALHSGRATARRQLTGDALAGTAALAVYAALLWLVTAGRIPLPAAGTAFVAVQSARALLTGLVNGINTSYRTGLYLQDHADFLTDCARRTRLPAAPAPLPDGPAAITLQHVAFTYPGSALPALEDIDLTVEPGQVLAIVGHNGSGKSTLAKLIAGLYHPTAGTVRWGSTDLADADPDQLWSRLAMIPQDVSRWPATARENITLGQGPTDDDAVLAAAEAAGADDVIRRLPDGLETNLAPSQWGGRDLSGGQWQRLAAARAFHRADASLVICDEPTSALDPLAEAAFYGRVRAIAAGRTVALITHRLGSTRTADKIVVLDGGRIVQHGTHDQLLQDQPDGLYARLWRLQASTYQNHPPVGTR
ncbi:ABC transporter ATP-binding protein [Kitasatospora sp. NPDC088783]|uniref:ABC transporter ATP-binding protein n=1 Tax=Kitasatospora sp. NPDC088783 TaxID=3364077 RepID=UPI0038289588